MTGTNIHFDIKDDKKSTLEKAVGIMLSQSGITPIQYKEHQTFGLIFSAYSAPQEGYSPIGEENVANFIWNWLKVQQYPPHEDDDIFYCRGFRIYNEEWKDLDNNFWAVGAVKPTWIEFLK